MIGDIPKNLEVLTFAQREELEEAEASLNATWIEAGRVKGQIARALGPAIGFRDGATDVVAEGAETDGIAAVYLARSGKDPASRFLAKIAELEGRLLKNNWVKLPEIAVKAQDEMEHEAAAAGLKTLDGKLVAARQRRRDRAWRKLENQVDAIAARVRQVDLGTARAEVYEGVVKNVERDVKLTRLKGITYPRSSRLRPDTELSLLESGLPSARDSGAAKWLQGKINMHTGFQPITKQRPPKTRV